ncbi:2-dehydro-3-deoxygluconokinase [Gracilibacillus ureilyticus]|uniref:2-dehydro-3-deoxygluconokinase n=1 Tax=Gracilibacillus ureilyticus TaxID=531814 RepID=A0A1H9MZZ1_9BACI|nr:sugar kinase [Gracilibacillus ureilyticus]SER28975.1 2-dehydro-3-deoxygluconokinase [Gracilibacillus ureilyticus]
MRVVTFGEMLMRLTTDPTVRLQQSNLFTYYYGGAEANVAVSLADFGVDTLYISKVPDNSIGEACEKYLQSNQIDTRHLLKGGDRLGLYFVESGIGNRSSQVTYDRKFSSFSQLKQEEVNWDRILEGADLFHTTGITLALSEELREITLEAMKQAKNRGIKVSFDFNFRAKLWSQQEASKAIEKVLPFIDIAFCNHMDAVHLLNIEVLENETDHEEKLTYYYKQIQAKYPNIQVFASTKREVVSSSSHRLEGYLFADQHISKTHTYTIEPVVDRIGGGDAYAAGVLFGILSKWDPDKTVHFATGASVLKHTLAGDGNAFSIAEVEQFTQNVSQEISR